MSVAPCIGAIVGGIDRARRCRPAHTEADAARLRSGCELALAQRQFPRVGRGPPAFTLVLRDPTQWRSLVTSRVPELLADAYFRYQIHVEGVLFSAGHEFGAYPIPGRSSPEIAIRAFGRAQDKAKQHVVADAKALGLKR